MVKQAQKQSSTPKSIQRLRWTSSVTHLRMTLYLALCAQQCSEDVAVVTVRMTPLASAGVRWHHSAVAFNHFHLLFCAMSENTLYFGLIGNL